jgi:glucose/mannose transport system substrate-binding protein
MLFENIFVARSDGMTYRDFFRGRGDAFSVAMQQSLNDLSRLLSYANADAATSSWTDALDKVATGKAAMTIMGDWAKGFLQFRGAKPDEDFGQIPMPGTAGTFVFTTDTFGSPKGAANHRGALDVLEMFASAEGQDLFNPIKGSISARDDTDVAAYDRMAQETIAAFRDASHDDGRLVPATAILCPPEYVTRINQALAAFVDVVDPPQPLALDNPSFLLHTLDNWSDLLRKSPLQ